MDQILKPWPFDVPAIEKQLRELLAERPEVVVAYLFGSLARGDHHERSDVDVAVLYREDPPPTLEGLGLGLESDLEAEIKHPVQVVVLNRAPVDLIRRVLLDGKLLKDDDTSRRIQFETKARREFFDLRPVLRRYRRMEIIV